MPTPDASQYTFIHKLQTAQECEKYIDPKKLRVARQYVTRPIGFDTLFGANALKSNKFLRDLMSLFGGGGSVGSTISGLTLSISADNKVITATWTTTPASQTSAGISFSNVLMTGLNQTNPTILNSATSQTIFSIAAGTPFVSNNTYSVNVQPTTGGVYTVGTPQTVTITVPTMSVLYSLSVSDSTPDNTRNILGIFVLPPNTRQITAIYFVERGQYLPLSVNGTGTMTLRKSGLPNVTMPFTVFSKQAQSSPNSDEYGYVFDVPSLPLLPVEYTDLLTGVSVEIVTP